MKKIMIMAALALTMGFVSCSKATPEEKAKELVEKLADAMKTLDASKIESLEKESEAYAEGLSAEEKVAFEKALEKYSEELLGDMLGGMGEETTETEAEPNDSI